MRKHANAVGNNSNKDAEENVSISSSSAGPPDASKLLHYARITYIAVFVVFFIIYWSIVLTSKSELEKSGLKL